MWLKNNASQELGININKIFLAGHSQGGYMVAQIASFSITQLGKAKIQHLKPYGNQKDAVYMLDLTHEFISSFENENRIPNHGFEAIV